MADSFTKKDRISKKINKRKEKEIKREIKKTTNNKGKSLEEQFVYVDYLGRLTSVPPHLQVVETSKTANRPNDKPVYNGFISHINEKGFGFIIEDKTKNNIFFQTKYLSDAIELKDRVSYIKENGEKGERALYITKI